MLESMNVEYVGDCMVEKKCLTDKFDMKKGDKSGFHL
jgi:hypothetical protein